MTIPAMPEVLPKHRAPLTLLHAVYSPKGRRALMLTPPNFHRHCAGVDETGHRCECLGRDA